MIRAAVPASARERLDFAHFAACEPRFERPVKAEHTIALNKRFHALPVGDEPTDLPSVATFRLHPNANVSGKRHPASNVTTSISRGFGENRMGDRLIFNAKAGSKHHAAANFATRTYEPIRQIEQPGFCVSCHTSTAEFQLPSLRRDIRRALQYRFNHCAPGRTSLAGKAGHRKSEWRQPSLGA